LIETAIDQSGRIALGRMSQSRFEALGAEISQRFFSLAYFKRMMKGMIQADAAATAPAPMQASQVAEQTIAEFRLSAAADFIS